MKDKKEIILDSMEKLLIEGSSFSISDVAKKAGIAKGGIYYYYSSKEEILDALIDRIYKNIIEVCNKTLNETNGDALSKLKLLFITYFNQNKNSFIDQYLHLPQNAYVHQKSLAKILNELSPILTRIILQGNQEGTFDCPHPEEYSDMILSVFTFLFDPGIFHWSAEKHQLKLVALADFMEKCLNIPSGSMSFLI